MAPSSQELYSLTNNIPTDSGLNTNERLNILIIGAGIGGLCAAYALGRAGHSVEVFEAASSLKPVGAGIQLSPNATRLLIRWGLGEELKRIAVVPGYICFRRYNDGEVLGRTDWSNMSENYGAPYYHVHRADLQNLLYENVKKVSKIRLQSKVKDLDPTKGALILENGAVYHGDLLIGGDGVRSFTREIVTGKADASEHTGDAAFRATVSTSKMMSDPLLRGLVEDPGFTSWIGPKRHFIGYCIRDKNEYNLVMVHPTSTENMKESYTVEGSIDTLKTEFEGWEPRIQKILSLVKSTLHSPLLDRSPLENWTHEGGKLTLLGDACHPMLPYRAQGAAMAIEDAAVLGALFKPSSFNNVSKTDVPRLLTAYQNLRHGRTSETQITARYNQKLLHLDDGRDQQARDLIMNGKGKGKSVNVWADKEKSRRQFGYDADAEARRWLEKAVDANPMHPGHNLPDLLV